MDRIAGLGGARLFRELALRRDSDMYAPRALPGESDAPPGNPPDVPACGWKTGYHVAALAQPSLVDLFIARATEAAAKVERIPRSVQEVRAAIARATEGAHTLVIAEGEFVPAAVISSARTLPGVIHKPTDDQLATADAGVTEAFAGVARTGSICIAMGGGLRAPASLLMPLHVALLPVERIVFRPRELFEPKGIGAEALKRNLAFVTGPSATADMGPLVRGVHGPHRLHILVLD